MSQPLQWRRYTAADETALRRSHARQCAALGEVFAFPALDDPRNLLVLVAEDESGIHGALLAHATVEVMFVGGSRRMVSDVVRRKNWLRALLRHSGADELHAFVPRARLRPMTALLQRLGFRRSNEQYVPFYRAL